MNFSVTPPYPPYATQVSDSVNGSYGTLLGYVSDNIDLDSISVFAFKNVAGGNTTVTADWLVSNQWQALMVCEIINVGINPTITLWGQLAPGPISATPTDLLSTGTQALGSAPALVVGLGSNETDTDPSQGYPAAGTGFTSIATGWNWLGREGTSMNNIAQLESRYYSNPGTVAATFTPRTPGPNPENFLTLGVAFQ